MIWKFALPSFLVAACFTSINGQMDLSDQSKGNPPSIDRLKDGFNALRGKPASEQFSDLTQLFNLTMVEKNDDVYNGFKEVRKILPVKRCRKTKESNTNFWAKSQSTLESISHTTFASYDKSFDLGITVPFKGIEVSAETTIKNTLGFGNSESSTITMKKSEEGYTHSINSVSWCTLYMAEVNYDKVFALDSWTDEFKNRCVKLGPDPSPRTMLNFFREVGTHGLEHVTFGKVCTGSIFMQGGRSDEDYHEITQSSDVVNRGLFWFEFTQNRKSETDSQHSFRKKFNYEYSNMSCNGELKSLSQFGGSGKFPQDFEDVPVILDWKYKPIWEMEVPGLSTKAKTNMKHLAADFVDASIKCAEQYCNGRGACAIDESKWDHEITTTDLDSFFNKDRCFCYKIGNVIAEGDRCDREPKHSSKLIQSEYGRTLNTLGNNLYYDAIVGDKQGVMSGIKSKHCNSHNDRTFQFKTSVPAENGVIISGREKTLTNRFQGHQKYQCPDNKVIIGLHSRYDSDQEDREMTVICGKFEGWNTRRCEWQSRYLNQGDHDLVASCHNGAPNWVMAGMESEYGGWSNDRQFKFYCCEFFRSDPKLLPPGNIRKRESEASVYLRSKK